jgi:hypothetical protein
MMQRLFLRSLGFCLFRLLVAFFHNFNVIVENCRDDRHHIGLNDTRADVF